MGYDPTGYLLDLGFDKAEVLTLRAALKSSAVKGTKGGVIVEWSANGSRVRKDFPLTEVELAAEVRFALEVLAPEEYPMVPHVAGARFV